MEKMYGELASWWHLLSPPEEYVEECKTFREIFLERSLGPDSTMLELGSGGGNNASFLKVLFSHVTLTDLSPQMLEVSRALNPDCDHIQGDMRTLRLGRRFDIVFVHDAVDYMTTIEDLRQAIRTAYAHCKPGGLALFVPDHVKETFQPSTGHGGTDGPDRATRYLDWSYDPDESDTRVTTEYVYLLREGTKPVRLEHETHVTGLFPRETWLGLLGQVGFECKIVRDAFGRDLFVANPR